MHKILLFVVPFLQLYRRNAVNDHFAEPINHPHAHSSGFVPCPSNVDRNCIRRSAPRQRWTARESCMHSCPDNEQEKQYDCNPYDCQTTWLQPFFRSRAGKESERKQHELEPKHAGPLSRLSRSRKTLCRFSSPSSQRRRSSAATGRAGTCRHPDRGEAVPVRPGRYQDR